MIKTQKYAVNKISSAMMPAVIMLSLALAIRQMSMTIVMPFISTYCKSLSGYTPFYAGLAIGIFGLMQAIFQIPFGILSDRFGNKRMLMIGLSQVIIGLVLAYFAKSMALLIFARALQGSGAIVGVGYSWAAGIAGEDGRIRAMGILGGFVSAAAALAFAAGPLLRQFMPVHVMFLTCAILLSFNALYILFFLKEKKPATVTPVSAADTASIRTLLHNRSFLTMNFAAFINNYMMIAVFYALPVYLATVTGETGMWKVFVPAILIAVLVMKQAVSLVQKGFEKQILMLAFLTAAFSIFFCCRKSSYPLLLLGATLFLCAYVTLATIVASKVNDVAEDRFRGAANGIFNSFQYIGNFIGAIVTGALWAVSETLTWSVTIGFGIAGFLLIAYDREQEKTVS